MKSGTSVVKRAKYDSDSCACNSETARLLKSIPSYLLRHIFNIMFKAVCFVVGVNFDVINVEESGTMPKALCTMKDLLRSSKNLFDKLIHCYSTAKFPCSLYSNTFLAYKYSEENGYKSDGM